MAKSNVTFKYSGKLKSSLSKVREVGVSGSITAMSTKQEVSSKSMSNFLDVIPELVSIKTFEYVCEAIKEACRWMTPGDFEAETGILNVTGNMYRSMGFLISRYDVKKKRLMRNRTITPATINNAKPATRVSLGKGEAYDLVKYYNGVYTTGHKQVTDLYRPFIGKITQGGQSGNEERKRFIQEMTQTGSVNKMNPCLWNIYAFVAMPYTNYVESYKGIHVAWWMAEKAKEQLQGNFGIKLL